MLVRRGSDWKEYKKWENKNRIKTRVVGGRVEGTLNVTLDAYHWLNISQKIRGEINLSNDFSFYLQY